MTAMTNYTTYDQAYYYADLRRLPRLSEEERRHLMTRLPTADSPHLCTQIKHQLIESYLPLATYFAIALCPRSRAHRDLPDLIGEANLTVVEVITRVDLTQINDLTGYLVAWMRGRVKGAITHDGLVKIDHAARMRARERGETDQTYALDHLLSLDEHMAWFDTADLEEPSVMPITPTQAAPPRDPVLRAQVETWLSYLSPRAQAILRLRHGLSDDNERSHTTAEIARALGLDRRAVLTTERDALTRLRAFVTGQATFGKKHGKPCICYSEAHNRYTITPEQEAAMLHAYGDLQAQDIIVTGRLLAQRTGTSLGQALMFLHLHRTETPKEARARQRERRLEEVCTRLEAQGGAGGQSTAGKRGRRDEADGTDLPPGTKEGEPRSALSAETRITSQRSASGGTGHLLPSGSNAPLRQAARLSKRSSVRGSPCTTATRSPATRIPSPRCSTSATGATPSIARKRGAAAFMASTGASACGANSSACLTSKRPRRSSNGFVPRDIARMTAWSVICLHGSLCV